jgi:hypothetical protein
MTQAALYLITHSFRNWLLTQARRLRSPRYILALALGSAYLWFFLGRGSTIGRYAPVAGETIQLAAALLLVFTIGRWWLFGSDSNALAFTPAEVQFLFPAPLTRRQLILFKLLRAQLLLLVNALVWTLILRRTGGAVGWWRHAIALWVLFSTLFLHRLGAALTRSTAGERLRARLPAWVWVVIVALGCFATWLAAVSLRNEATALALPNAFVALWHGLDSPTAHVVLWPFTALLRPVTANTIQEWLRGMGPAVLLLLVHMGWVVSADRAFEEAAVEASARREALLDRWRREGRSASRQATSARLALPLQPSGHPVWALLWKNLTRALREERPSLFIAAMLLIVVAAAIGGAGGGAEGVYAVLFGLGASWIAVLVVFGPQWIRNDIRSDMSRLAVLRTLPVDGTTLMAGQVFSSAIVLTLYQLFLLIVTAIGALGSTHIGIRVNEAAVVALCAMLLLPALNVVAMGIQNGGALLYPGWVRSDLRPGGVEALGQHLLAGSVCLLLLVLAALVPCALGYGLALWIYPWIGLNAAVPGAAVACAAIGVEGFLLLDWLGGRFESLDLSNLA